MGQDDGGADPLLGAIAGFRQELLHWIDHRIGRLNEQGEEAEPVARAERHPPQPIRVEPPQPVPEGDARTRLDTLARQLSDRLRGGEAPRSSSGRPGNAEEGRTPAR